MSAEKIVTIPVKGAASRLDAPGRMMRILVEPSDYPRLQNLGDITMQQTAVGRLASFWPAADIRVLTDDPAGLPPYAPNVRPLGTAGRVAWMNGLFPRLRYHLHLPYSAERAALSAGRALRLRLPFAVRDEVRAYLDAVSGSDLLAVCGMGGVTDVFIPYAPHLLDAIDVAKAHGKTVVMFGQGVGPLNRNAHVRRRASEVLPKVDFIALREGYSSPRLLQELGVSAGRVMVTGDDAVEFAARNACAGSSDALGVNLRLARYSEITPSVLPELRAVLHAFAESRRAPLVGVPSDVGPDGDGPAVSALLAGYPHIRAGNVADPKSLAHRLSDCRVLFSGSYHAAVFALSQGVPAVCLESSEYYRGKWMGLRHQFGAGVFAVSLAAADWRERARQALDEAWDTADTVKPVLRAAAEEQIALGHQAYERVRTLVNERLGS